MTEITKEILVNWWIKYSKVIYSLDELEKFESIIDKYGVQKVFTAVIASFLVEDGSPTTLLMAIRADCIEKFFDCIPEELDEKVSKIVLNQLLC